MYIIKCNICNIYYIGETSKKAKERINEHLNNIKNFKKNLRKSLSNFNSQTEIAIHFNEKKHQESDFNFFIFKNNITNIILRRSVETDLINLFLLFRIPILNKKIPNINSIKKFSFY